MNIWGKIKLRRALESGGTQSLSAGRFGAKGTANMRSGYVVAAGPVKVGRGTRVEVESLYGEGVAALHVGERVTIGPGCVVRVNHSVRLGSGVALGASVRLADSVDPESTPLHLRRTAPIKIADGVTVGAGATILPGAMVNRDVAPGEVFAGSN